MFWCRKEIQHNSEYVAGPFEANGKANWGQRLKTGIVHLLTSLPPTQRQLVALWQIMCTHQWGNFSLLHSFGIFPSCPLACLSLLLCLTLPFSKPGLSSSSLTSSLNYRMSTSKYHLSSGLERQLLSEPYTCLHTGNYWWSVCCIWLKSIFPQQPSKCCAVRWQLERCW